MNALPTVPPSRPLREELFVHLPSLRGRALKLCLNASEANDLVQDTIERALRFEDSYCPGTNLRAWLQQVLYSVFVTRCRKGARERRALHALTHDPCAWTHRDALPVHMALSRHTERAIGELPPTFRDVVRLVDLDERSYKDAAQLLDVPVGTVMSRLFRARRMLREALAPVDESLQAA